MAVVALASRALAARDLAAAARRGRRLARRARWAAHGPRAPRGDARRRARRGVHRRLGRRPRRPVTHPHPSDDPPRGGHRPLARRPHGRGYTGAGPALRHGRGVVRARDVNPPVLLVRGVTRRRRGAAAPVADASLELAAGEVVALVGPPGSGKTTLLAITAGRLAPDAGSVMVAGVATGTLAARALLGYAPAAPVFPPTLRVREVLEYFARFHVVGVARRGLVAAALERSGLAGAAERRAAGLPLPLARRLALAQAVLGHRRVLLLDETLSGVDAAGRRAVCERVRELAASGVAVLLASSDLAAVEQVAARVFVMRDGRLVREAPTSALLRERVLEILLDAPPAAPPPGFRLTPYGLQTDLGPSSAEAALALCREHRLAVRASRVRFRTLEDALLDAQGDGAR